MIGLNLYKFTHWDFFAPVDFPNPWTTQFSGEIPLFIKNKVTGDAARRIHKVLTRFILTQNATMIKRIPA